MSNIYGNTERGDERLLREMRKEIESLRRKLAKQTDWQPISTAPRDIGAKILATWADSWKTNAPHVEVCELGEELDWFYAQDGDRPTHQPTHWAPLPEPPKEEGK